MNQRHFWSLCVLALPLLIAGTLDAADPTNLRCEYVHNPLGVDTPRPRLSWTMEDRSEAGAAARGERGIRQTAYQVAVASAVRLLEKDRGDVWDSSKVASDRSIAIPYGGPALESGRTYYWRVRVWDGKGAVSSWSDAARLTKGKLKPEDWSARWIGVPPTSAAADLEGVVIDRATYRTLDGKVAVDVTPILKKALEERRIPFHVEQPDGWFLEMVCDKACLTGSKGKLATSELLGKAPVPMLPYENPDGSRVTIDSDYFGKKHDSEHPASGPFTKPGEGNIRIRVWK